MKTIIILLLSTMAWGQSIKLPVKDDLVKNDTTKIIKIPEKTPNQRFKIVRGAAVISDRKPDGLVKKTIDKDGKGAYEFDLMFHPVDTIYERYDNLIFETVILENSQGFQIEERKDLYEVEKIEKPIKSR